MPQVERELVKARAARLRHAAAERGSSWLNSLIGSTQPVLIENNEKGHSDAFAPIKIEGTKRGEIGQALITGRNENHLTAVWA